MIGFLSTQDIWYLVLSFCLLWFTIMVCWALYYIVSMLREASKMVKDVRKKIELVEKVLIAFKEKLEDTSSHMKLLVETAINVAEFIKDRKKEKKGKKKK